MQFRFDANQEYQLRAIEAVADLFEGQSRLETGMTLEVEAGVAAVANRLDLSEAALHGNLIEVQRRLILPEDSALQCLEDTIQTVAGPKAARFANFSIEMETGTGKTYVYLRTALELYRRYGMRKYIVVVPSVAIREGVLKTLQVTEQHLRELYHNAPYRYCVYDSGNLTQVRQFAMSDGVEIMVMTIDAFNKASNIIHQSTDRLMGETPVHFVQASRPILILDEPQNMESELRIKALAALDPLFALRYSATHRNPYNLVYRLTPFEAYRQRLVKRIEVASVVSDSDANRVFVQLLEVKTEKRTLTARLNVHKLMKTGVVKEAKVTVKPGDSLVAKTGRDDYDGYEIAEIDAGAGLVRFANDIEVTLGQAVGADREALFRAQISETIEAHFKKQRRVRENGVKVLSLFFIDRVDNYIADDGVIKRLFDEEFRRIGAARFPEWAEVDPASVRAAYFAERRHKGGVREAIDTTGVSRADEDAYDLIMRDKERLLSLDEPVAFVFSHSALREGWDNPNVFQICTLHQTASEVKKRQEIGRGVRLAVDQTGERLHDEQLNVLTVVANEAYEKYVAGLQREIEDEYGTDGTPPPPPRADRPKAVLRKERALSLEFKELWERIRRKTRYQVRIDSKRLIADACAALAKVEVAAPHIRVTRATVEAVGESLEAHLTGTRVGDKVRPEALPNVVALVESLLEYTSPPMRLSRRTILAIIAGAGNVDAMTRNPHDFATAAVRIIKEKMSAQLADGIRYERIDDWYAMDRFLEEDEIDLFGQYVEPVAYDNALYTQIACDSLVERDFVRGLETRDDVKLFLKLPAWFTVPTPVGEYNPDWAIVLDREGTGERVFLVRETKSADELRPNERMKTDCGKVHFEGALEVSYEVVTKATEIE
jgi:type III restriction enzyme